MRILGLLAAQALITAGGLVIYDAVREAPVERLVAETTTDSTIDPEAIEERLADLERSSRPMLAATGSDPRLLKRIDALERELDTLRADAARGPAPAASEEPSLPRVAPLVPNPTLSDEEVHRFRRVREAAARLDRIEKQRARVRNALAKTDVRLSASQERKVEEAFADFQPRIDAIWTEVKQEAQATAAAGGTVDRREIVTSTMARIQTEFAGTIDNVVDAREAESIARVLLGSGK